MASDTNAAPTAYISPAVTAQPGINGKISSSDTGTRVPNGTANPAGGKTPSAMSKNQ